MAEEIERIYVIPLKKKRFKSSKAAPHGIKTVKKYLTRHMKVEQDKIWIDDSLNNAIWSKGKYHIPSKIRVKAVKFDDGVVEAYLPELEFKKSRRELLREEKEKKEPILKKEEGPSEESEEATGADDYAISPSADGEVKIKKKKALKDKEEKKPAKKTAKKTKKPAKKEKKEEKPSKPKTSKKKEGKKAKTTKKKSPPKKTTSSKAKSTKKTTSKK